MIAHLLRPSKPLTELVFVRVPQPLPVRHAFDHAGVRYEVTGWQHKVRLGYLVALAVCA